MGEDLFLLSHPDLAIGCPFCSNESVNLIDHLFQGIHVLAKLNCTNCNHSFFRTLPVGHDLLFPSSVDETGKLLNIDVQKEQWLVRPLIESFSDEKKIHINIEKELFRHANDAIILNCLDNCFGHSFFKLLNLQILKSKYPEKAVIVFVPKRMRWLLPSGVDEVWSFDASFADLEKRIINLDDEVRRNILAKFSRVFVSKAFTHLDLAKVGLKDFLKTERFDLDRFDRIPPRITFVLRDDRFWHRYPIEYFVFKVVVKLGLSKKIFAWRQRLLVNSVAKKIKKKLAHAEFYATGLGRTGRLSSLIKDLRDASPDAQREKQWCELYSTSHSVIGVHGSNMLIPTALAAGFVEILPRHKIRHISEDTLLRYDSRYTLFFGRHLDHFASTDLVSGHVLSMLKDFAYLHANTRQT